VKVLVVDHNAVDPLGQRIYEELQADGEFEFRVLVPRLWHDTFQLTGGEERRREEGLDVVPVPVHFFTRTHRLIYPTLGAEIRRFEPDVLFLNVEPENFAACQAALILHRRPSIAFGVTSWRNIDYRENPFPYKAGFLNRWIEKRVRLRADGCVAFSSTAGAILKDAGFRNVAVIAPYVDTEFFSPADLRPARPFTAGYAGRLHRLKGVDLLLDALCTLPKGIRLSVIGNGPEEEALRRKCAADGLASRVEWKGAVGRERMLGEYQALDALVLPSRTGRHWKEQFGRVLIEAMSCGVPVIGSDSGEIPHVIGPAGLLFPEGDANALAACLAKVAESPDLPGKLSRAGRERALSMYAVPVAKRAYASFLKGIGVARGAV
jgi:glycosyltransferase involved in cell wall biosynthesis